MLDAVGQMIQDAKMELSDQIYRLHQQLVYPLTAPRPEYHYSPSAGRHMCNARHVDNKY